MGNRPTGPDYIKRHVAALLVELEADARQGHHAEPQRREDWGESAECADTATQRDGDPRKTILVA
jgi:hypothetical protein